MREGRRRLSCPVAFPGRFPERPAGGESPGGSGWRSCAAAQQLPKLAAAERWAGKLSSALFQLAAGGSPPDTPPPRYVRARPRGAAARATSLAPVPAAGSAGCAVLVGAARGSVPVRGRGRTGRPDPRAREGGVGPAVFTLGRAGTSGPRCVGSGRPGSGGQRSRRCAVLGKTPVLSLPLRGFFRPPPGADHFHLGA